MSRLAQECSNCRNSKAKQCSKGLCRPCQNRSGNTVVGRSGIPLILTKQIIQAEERAPVAKWLTRRSYISIPCILVRRISWVRLPPGALVLCNFAIFCQLNFYLSASSSRFFMMQSQMPQATVQVTDHDPHEVGFLQSHCASFIEHANGLMEDFPASTQMSAVKHTAQRLGFDWRPPSMLGIAYPVDETI